MLLKIRKKFEKLAVERIPEVFLFKFTKIFKRKSVVTDFQSLLPTTLETNDERNYLARYVPQSMITDRVGSVMIELRSDWIGPSLLVTDY